MIGLVWLWPHPGHKGGEFASCRAKGVIWGGK